jgi:membrane-bound ClpP family serine protease
MKILCIICAAMLLLGCFQLPIQYYTFLRIIVSLGALGILAREVQKDVNLFGIAFIIIIILFNPIVPIYLYKKSIWIPIDLITALLFLAFIIREKSTKKQKHD